jgi:UDP-glucose 4-epimerase
VKLLITGAGGFVGSAIVRVALARGHEVTVLSRPDSSQRRLADVATRVRIALLRTTSPLGLREVVSDHAPDAVIHAGWHGVEGGARQDLQQVTVNVPFAVGLAAAARASACPVFLGLGSQAEYGPHQEVISEDTATQPVTLYGAAKLAVAHALSAQLASTRTRFVWLRIFSSYGPDDNPGVMLTYLVRALIAGERPELTACEQRWDFVFVDDVAAAALDLVQTETATGIFNVGSGEAILLRSILEGVRDMIDPALPLGFGARAYGESQVMRLQADVSRLVKATGWSPRVTLDDGLRRTVRAERARSDASATLQSPLNAR